MNRAVSHELLAPLNSTMQNANLMLKTKLTEYQKRMMNTILTSSHLVLCYSNDLIDHNVMEHGKLLPHFEFGSPAQTIFEIIEVIRNDCKSKKLGLCMQLDTINNLQMEFDRQRL